VTVTASDGYGNASGTFNSTYSFALSFTPETWGDLFDLTTSALTDVTLTKTLEFSQDTKPVYDSVNKYYTYGIGDKHEFTATWPTENLGDYDIIIDFEMYFESNGNADYSFLELFGKTGGSWATLATRYGHAGMF
jgi:hypothetical protein